MNETVSSFSQTTLPVLATCDAVVIGGSFSGFAVALLLADAGHSVTLVEPRTYLGREITATLRPWSPLPPSAWLPETDEEPIRSMDALKLRLEDVLIAAGVKLLYASVAVGIQQGAGGLQGVVIGNKSGRQVIQCRLLIDTSETALVARLLGEPFAPAPTTVNYRRTLEYDGVGTDLALDKPLVIDGMTATLHRGYRGRDHVLVEFALDLPFAFDDVFDLARREIYAREQTMAFAAALAQRVPAFASAYLSGAAYELYGRHAPALERTAPPAWAAALDWARYAGAVRGVWYLNESVEPTNPERFYSAGPALDAGTEMGHWLEWNWDDASAPIHPAAPLAVTTTLDPAIREPSDPQRGRAYHRTPVTTDPSPTLREVDVLVVGGGSSGATAAITAGREGMRTVLVEMNPGLGGTGTFGGVHSYWFGRRIGFSEQVMKLVDDMHVYLHHPQPQGIIPKWNIEAKSYALLKAATDSGVEVLFNAFVVGALVEDQRVCGVVVATRMGLGIIRARVVIDATGDGDVAAFAGADYVYGNERDHVVMWYALAQFPRPGLTRNHFTSMVDVSNVEDYTRAILAGRRRGGQGELHDHGIYVAPRESRHIKADVVLTLTDQLRQRRWQDVINVAFSNHDIKGHTGSDWLRIGLIPPNLEVEIPYRALLPCGLDGILVVGKAISATHDALPAIRMQADLENLGGVAALAAAQAIRANIAPRDIDVRRLQARLVHEAVLPEAVLDRTIQPPVYSVDELRQMIDTLPVMPLYQYSDMELTDLYEGVIPLVEICCAGARVVPLLEEAHANAEGERQILLAQMLALVGSTAGVPTLIDAIETQLQGDQLPVRKAHIRYTQLPPDHGAMPEVVYLLYSLGMTPDHRALAIWQRVVELLAAAREADFYEEMKGVFYYADVVSYGQNAPLRPT